MRILWIDTETTGLDYDRNGIFEFACIFTEKVVGSNARPVYCERDFFLNPLSEGLEYSEEAAKIHGITREDMEKFPAEKDAVERIVAFLEDAEKFGSGGKMIFCGYNSTFDWNMTEKMLGRHGYRMDDYFDKRADVFEQVKSAGRLKVIPYLENRRLTTLCKHFKIDLENAHTALADIRATRELARVLQKSGVNLI